MGAIMARAGDVIRDKDGAVFATFERDIFRGAHMQCGDIKFADGRRPVAGEPIPRPVLDWLLA